MSLLWEMLSSALLLLGLADNEALKADFCVQKLKKMQYINFY